MKLRINKSAQIDLEFDAKTDLKWEFPLFFPEQYQALAALMLPAVPTEVFASYWYFASERQNIFYKRLGDQSPPWSSDQIIANHRFTNVYRVLDRVSQYLIHEVQHDDSWSESDLLFRTLLFKLFNRISTWKLLKTELGELTASGFTPTRYSKVLESAISNNSRIYSAAYIMPSGGPNSPHRRKHDMHLALLKRMLEDRLPQKIAEAKSMKDAYALLLAYPTIGDFLAYQYVTDLNYSELTDFSEMEFVVAGPGAKEGIQKCFSSLGGKSTEWIIRRVAEVQDRAFKALGLEFRSLPGRSLQLIDCQNVFCELAKYARIRHPEYNGPMGRSRIKQKFSPLAMGIPFGLPPKWQSHP
jgi:hypothetical protein